MNKPEYYHEVFALVESSYRFGEHNNTTKKYFTTENKASVEFYDKVSYYSSENTTIKQLDILKVLVTDDIGKWTYEISVEKDVIKIW